MSTNPRELLDTMLGYLGFVAEIEEVQKPDGLLLQVHTGEADLLIGSRGETMEDLQFLLNRLLQIEDKGAPRVQVDIEHHRQMREDELVQQVRRQAEGVRQTGVAVELEPMNSYQRRIVHNAFKDDPDIATSSPQDDARLKRITLSRRRATSDGG